MLPAQNEGEIAMTSSRSVRKFSRTYGVKFAFLYFCSEPIKFYENYTNLTAGWFQVRACNLTEISASKSTSANSEFWGSSKISFLPFYTFFHNPPYIQGFLGLKKCAIQHWLLLYIFDCVFNIFWDIMWKIQNLKQFAQPFCYF